MTDSTMKASCNFNFNIDDDMLRALILKLGTWCCSINQFYNLDWLGADNTRRIELGPKLVLNRHYSSRSDVADEHSCKVSDALHNLKSVTLEILELFLLHEPDRFQSNYALAGLNSLLKMVLVVHWHLINSEYSLFRTFPLRGARKKEFWLGKPSALALVANGSKGFVD
jgi:hypothetical protein